jgi:hypothetical protein
VLIETDFGFIAILFEMPVSQIAMLQKMLESGSERRHPGWQQKLEDHQHGVGFKAMN